MKKAANTALACIIALLAGSCMHTHFPLEQESPDIGPFGVKHGNKWLVKPQYEEYEIVPGKRYAWVGKAGSWSLINRKGEALIACASDKYWEVGDYQYIYRCNGKYGLVTAGKELAVAAPLYDTINIVGWELREKKGIVKRDGKYGLLGVDGKETILPRYDSLVYVEQNRWMEQFGCRKNGKWGLVNDDGHEVVAPRYDSIAVVYYSCTRMLVRLNNTLVFMDHEGKNCNRELPDYEWDFYRNYQSWDLRLQ